MFFLLYIYINYKQGRQIMTEKDRLSKRLEDAQKLSEKERKIDEEKERQKEERKKNEEEVKRRKKSEEEANQLKKAQKESEVSTRAEIREALKNRNIAIVVLTIIATIVALIVMGGQNSKDLEKMLGWIVMGLFFSLFFPPIILIAGIGLLFILIFIAVVALPVALGTAITVFILSEILLRIVYGFNFRDKI